MINNFSLTGRSIPFVLIPLLDFPESPKEILLLNYQGYFCLSYRQKIISVYGTPTMNHPHIYWDPLT